MSNLPLRTRVWIVLLVLIASAAFAVASLYYELDLTQEAIIIAIILCTLIVFAEIYNITLPQMSGTVHISVGAAVALAAGITLGPIVGGLVVMIAHVIDSVHARRPLIKSVTNVANVGLATVSSAVVYLALAQAQASPLASLRNIGSVFVAGVVFIVINFGLLGLIVAPIVGQTLSQWCRTNLRGIYVELVTLPTLGGLVPVLANESPIAILLLVIPLIGPYLAYKALQKVQQETQETMESLADALERRDAYTHHHSIRVTDHVRAILDEMPQIPFETREAIIAAARIHDLGKVGTLDVALNKAGPLTPEERQEMQRHSTIGADIVEHLEVYRHCAAVVRHHHERWDGRGYPDGLKGEEIPIGARIICVADSFDAMTSDRVYRKAMAPEAALAELRAHSGTQFDPQVVAAFERAMTSAPAPVETRMTTPVPGRTAVAK